ncbi:uncharacterized protein LOC123529759 [Mercenaria mercenaria]|uniref:uncharacterized protein LOC123529759 n=1 Tax=Mercenaria mercenaria TaxID=6596 RepID=UPI00234EACA3|nr:uncharacterized protein LOC123529759 [Mercenaria mercenaria]
MNNAIYAGSQLKKMDNICVNLFLLGIQIIGYAHGEEYCINTDTGNKYCESCCGSWPRQYCCEETSWIVGVAVGCTFGALFIIGVCVVLYCIIQQKGKSGRVIQASTVGQPPVCTSTVVSHAPYRQQDQQGVSYGNQGVPYGQQGVPYGNQGVPYGQQGVPYGNQGLSYGQQASAPPLAYPPPQSPPSTQNLYGNQALT